jgi:hypothetical protein
VKPPVEGVVEIITDNMPSHDILNLLLLDYSLIS